MKLDCYSYVFIYAYHSLVGIQSQFDINNLVIDKLFTFRKAILSNIVILLLQILHFPGTNQTSTPLNKVGKENNVNSHYANTNLQPSDPRLQGISALRGSRIGGATIVNQNFENSVPSLGAEVGGVGSNWPGQGPSDASKVYSYGPPAQNTSGSSTGSYPLQVI